MALRGAPAAVLTAATLTAATLTAGAWPAAAMATTWRPAAAAAGQDAGHDIVVTPSMPRPGQRVHVTVPGCSVGPTAHTLVSAAFPADVALHGKADTGDADVTIRSELKPGTYAIAAHCGATTVQGRVDVTGESGPPAGRKTDYWLLVVPIVVLGAVAGVFLLRRRENG